MIEKGIEMGILSLVTKLRLTVTMATGKFASIALIVV